MIFQTPPISLKTKKINSGDYEIVGKTFPSDFKIATIELKNHKHISQRLGDPWDKISRLS